MVDLSQLTLKIIFKDDCLKGTIPENQFVGTILKPSLSVTYYFFSIHGIVWLLLIDSEDHCLLSVKNMCISVTWAFNYNIWHILGWV